MRTMGPEGVDGIAPTRQSGQQLAQLAPLNVGPRQPGRQPGETKARDGRLGDGVEIVHLQPPSGLNLAPCLGLLPPPRQHPPLAQIGNALMIR